MDDGIIIGLYLDRDERAIEKTREKYGSYLRRVSYNILRNEEDTEECLNDTYLKTWNSIPPNKPSVLSAYLAKIARNLSFDRYRQSRAGKRGGGETALVLEELSECVSSAETVEGSVERAELLREINAFLTGLPREQRELFMLRYWYVMSVEEIAEKTGERRGTVTVRLSRIRKSLREYLAGRGYEI